MADGGADKLFELFWVDEAIVVLVVDAECLSDTLANQTSHHLGKLFVGDLMSLVRAAEVKCCPVREKVERDAFWVSVLLVDFLNVTRFDQSLPLSVEKSKRYLVLRIALGKEVLEGSPVPECNLAFLAAVGDWKEDAILLAQNLVLDIFSKN